MLIACLNEALPRVCNNETSHTFSHKLLHMFSRNSQPASSSNAPAERAFVEDVEDLLGENLVSAQRTAEILHKASKAGIRGINRRIRKTTGRNQARDHFRTKLKWSKMA